jgi:hypothetical protein
MSTTKPRITVTLEPRTYEVVSRLSAAGGESMSQIVSQFVDLAVPSLERVVVILERAKAAPEEVRSGLSVAIERAERDMLPGMLASVDQFDMFLADAERATSPSARRRASGARRGRTAAAPAASTPVPVTRGSGGGKTLRSGVVRKSGKGGRHG